MTTNAKRQAILLRQLEDVEQQIAHVIRLAEEDDACLDIVRQCQATRAALNAASLTLLETCLQSSAAQAVACPDAACRTQQVARLSELYEALRRLTGHSPRRT
jgi:DNA-binding FrmR family transcriptional regulator